MGYGWGMGFGWLIMIIFWGLVILGIAYIVKSLAGGVKKEEKDTTPVEILKKRYAKGEITKDEFEKMKDDLKKE
ncbi:MAG: hypothetical protein A2X59_05450 [Nitrospirae bacterium GWC2_42_7]|nr:MAG: hypothetical protein A2X59_05450 [Nitrospirae bacterium GWC2_42_7]